MACIDDEDVAHLLRWVQDGVVSRRQLLELGLADHDIRREVRRRRLTQVHRGVLVNHSGPLSWEQRAWAAVLVHAPAALTLDSALPGPRRADRPIHVAIDLHRTVPRVRGVVAHRTARWSERVAVGASPPRLRLEEAAVEVAVRARDRGSPSSASPPSATPVAPALSRSRQRCASGVGCPTGRCCSS